MEEDRPATAVATTSQAIGDQLAAVVERLLDDSEEASLWLLEAAATALPENPMLGVAGRSLAQARRATTPLPALAGRLTAASTRLTLGLGLQALAKATRWLEAGTRQLTPPADREAGHGR